MPKLNDADASKRAERSLSDGVNPSDFSEALARGLGVITAFDSEHKSMTLAELSRVLSLPRATVRRALTTLVHLGYVVAEGRVFRLSPKVMTLASAYLSSNAISAILQPTCERLCAEIGESCSVAVLDEDAVVMIARAIPNRLPTQGVGIGYRVPALHSSLGRVLLSGLDTENLQKFLDAAEIVPPTGESVTDKRELRNLIDRVRLDGFAYVRCEAERGFQSVAVPLYRWDGQIIAALNVGASVDRIDRESMIGPVLDLLKQTAQVLSKELI